MNKIEKIFFATCLSLTFKKTYTLHYSESSNLDYKVYNGEKQTVITRCKTKLTEEAEKL